MFSVASLNVEGLHYVYFSPAPFLRLWYPGWFVSDILESDIVCKIGQEDRKLLLFDDFLCIDEGVVMGKVSPEVIKEMPKSN